MQLFSHHADVEFRLTADRGLEIDEFVKGERYER